MLRRRPRGIRAFGLCAAISVGAGLGLFAAPAMAAPPNDHFTERTQLGSSLPISVTGSNEGATRDNGEPASLFNFGKGHTVWWEWESPTTGWITVDTCQSNFLTVLGIFKGTEVEYLRPVAEGNADEWPGCQASGTAYVFHAETGGHYVIGVDGNGLYGPPIPPAEPHIPSGEGQIALTIEPTPIPPNDALEGATPLPGLGEGGANPFEPPSDDRHFRGFVRGYNWGATKQAGEPDHAGDPGGASVWYSFTPPESGELQLSTNGAGPVIALYEGTTTAHLRPLASGSGTLPSLRAQVTAGTEYRIAVDGRRSASTGEPWMGSFTLNVELNLPPLPPTPASPAAVGPPKPPASNPPPASPFPWTKVTGHKVDSAGRSAVISFASVPGANFSCKLDSGRPRHCSSPDRLRGLRPGKHRLEIVARNAAGSDPTPAVVHFFIAAPRRHPH